jgi:hypothetical protein
MQDLFAHIFWETPLTGKLTSEEEELFRRHMRLTHYKENKLLVAGDARCEEVLMVLKGAFVFLRCQRRGAKSPCIA